MHQSTYNLIPVPEDTRHSLTQLTDRLQRYPSFFAEFDLCRKRISKKKLRSALEDSLLQKDPIERLIEDLHANLAPSLDTFLSGAKSLELRSIDPFLSEEASSVEIFEPWHLDKRRFRLIVVNRVPTQVATVMFDYDLDRYAIDEQFREKKDEGFDRYIKDQIRMGSMQAISIPFLTCLELNDRTVHRMLPICEQNPNPGVKRVTVRVGY